MKANKFNFGVFTILSLAHLVNDLYASFMPQFLPWIKADMGLTVAEGTALVAIFTISSSLLQPVFGYLVDLKGQRWLVYVGTLWMAVLLSMTGFISSYSLLLFVSALAGLGTAAFHPQAAAMAGQLSGQRKGLVVSTFIASGNIGMALSPLILLPLFDYYGTQTTWFLFIPGVLTALGLYLYAPKEKNPRRNIQGLKQVMVAFKKSSSELSKLMLIVSIRSLVHTALMTLLPLYLLSLDYSSQVTGYIMFGTLGVGAIGGILGGLISDTYGGKPLIVGSLILAPLMFYGYFHTSGLLSYLLLSLGGMGLLSSFSVTVVMTQQIIPENKALASGLSLGFAIGIGGLAVYGLGVYADYVGLKATIQLVFALPLLAGFIGLFLKVPEPKQFETVNKAT